MTTNPLSDDTIRDLMNIDEQIYTADLLSGEPGNDELDDDDEGTDP